MMRLMHHWFDQRILAMSEEVWNKVYKSDSTFFGEEPNTLMSPY
jgi:hypothetical protein